MTTNGTRGSRESSTWGSPAARKNGHINDLPQAVAAAVHPGAHLLLERDVTNLTCHFARYGIPDDGAGIAAGLWRRCERAEI